MFLELTVNLVQLLKRDAKDQLIVTENLPVEADVTHFHTIDLPYYLSTFQKKRSGRRVGYVHFLPDTLEGSLKIPFFLKGIVKRYVFSFYDRMEHLDCGQSYLHLRIWLLLEFHVKK